VNDDTNEAPSQSVFKKRLLTGIFLGLLVYAGLGFWGDASEIGAELQAFNLWLVPVALGLSFLNYVVRFARWERYRVLLNIELDRTTSFLIYLAGLSLTVTPGKMGEAFKSWLIRRIDGTPVAVSAPIVVAERFTDLLAFLVLVAIGGLATQPEYAWIFWTTLGLCGVLLVCFSSARVGNFACACVAKLPVVGRLAPKVREAFASTRRLMSPKELIMPTLVSTLGWGLECTAFYLVANAFGAGVPYLFAVYTFALSAVAGAVLILAPGGLGVTEGALTGLLEARYVSLGLDAARSKAASATFVIRLCTLWFAVVVGLVALGLFERRAARLAGEPS